MPDFSVPVSSAVASPTSAQLSTQSGAIASMPTQLTPGLIVRPVGAYALHGIALAGKRLLAMDALRGYVLQIDPETDNATLLNPRHVQQFEQSTGLSVVDNQLWYTQGHNVFYCDLDNWIPQPFIRLPYEADGVAVWNATVYVTSRKGGYIAIYDRTTQRLITRFSLPGIGRENISVSEEYLWLCDQTEQTVFCLDRATGEQVCSVLTPFASPTGIAVAADATPEGGKIWIAYADEEAYIRDDPNSENPHQLTFRDRTFLHSLQFVYNREKGYTRSNGYLLEMTYAEEISPLDPVMLKPLTWRIALPTDTDRQRVRQVEPVGLPFTEEIINGQRVAAFHFEELGPYESHLFGWKALIEVHGIKYQLNQRQLERCPPLPEDYSQRYLIDDDELAMDNPIVQAAAKEAVGRETNLLRQVLSIRNYVYDRLSYGIKPHIDTPDVVLERGIGSCGEYVGLLLALCRLNGIACRTVGRYKCPPYADRQGVPLEPDFNHVWLEFYVPGVGWLPMESNVDDVIDGGPYPTRFFMGLPWYHVEMGKGVSFEKIETPPQDPPVKLGDLALNHVRFKILKELPPDSPDQN
jgi:transglutaminase-like putative cysteine protease